LRLGTRHHGKARKRSERHKKGSHQGPTPTLFKRGKRALHIKKGLKWEAGKKVEKLIFRDGIFLEIKRKKRSHKGSGGGKKRAKELEKGGRRKKR